MRNLLRWTARTGAVLAIVAVLAVADPAFAQNLDRQETWLDARIRESGNVVPDCTRDDLGLGNHSMPPGTGHDQVACLALKGIWYGRALGAENVLQTWDRALMKQMAETDSLAAAFGPEWVYRCDLDVSLSECLNLKLIRLGMAVRDKQWIDHRYFRRGLGPPPNNVPWEAEPEQVPPGPK